MITKYNKSSLFLHKHVDSPETECLLNNTENVDERAHRKPRTSKLRTGIVFVKNFQSYWVNKWKSNMTALPGSVDRGRRLGTLNAMSS